jgi:hypothetical protein
MGSFGTGLTCGCRGRFGGWRNKLTYSMGDSCCPAAGDGCCSSGYSATNWTDASTWGAPAATETVVEPEPLPAGKPVDESSNWQAPSDWNVTEAETFNAPVETPTSQKGPFYNDPQQNGRNGSKQTQDQQTDDVPGGAEIDEFLNDA